VRSEPFDSAQGEHEKGGRPGQKTENRQQKTDYIYHLSKKRKPKGLNIDD
jgi:hypothetical protein